MSEFFAEATIQLRPDLTGFIGKLRKEVKSAIDAVETGPRTPKIHVAPALTRDFVGQLRKQANTAILQAGRKLQPLRVQATISVSPVEIARSLREAELLIQSRVGAGIPIAAAAGAGAVAGGAAGDIGRLSAEQQEFNKQLALGGRLLPEQVRLTEQLGEASKGRGRSLKREAGDTQKQTQSTRSLLKIEQLLLETELAEAGSKAERDARRGIESAAIKGLAAAKIEENRAIQETIEKIRLENAEKRRSLETDAKRQAAIRRTVTAAVATPVAGPVQLRSLQDLTRVQQELSAAQNRDLDIARRRTIQSQAVTAAARIQTRAVNELAAALALAVATQGRFPAVSARAFGAAGQAFGVASTAGRVVSETEAALAAEKRAREQMVASTRETNKALREEQRESTRSARSHEQLRRGVASTGLSFLGIRGATLAASASFLAGAAALSVFAKALQNASEFTQQLNVFRATAGATAEEMERVREAARALGADLSLPGVTASDAATAMVELAKAGLSVQDSIDGARGVLQLATAAAIDNAQAVELAANALNAFQLQGRDATRVADTFANAANAAQGSIVDIGIAFQQAAAAGRQVGLSFEDTTTFLTILARNGLRGSDAGTSLRTALIRLIRPTEAARDRLRELGITLRDAQGNLRPDIFLQLANATRDLSPAARDASIALIGGQDAFRAISILGRQSIDEFLRLRRELRQQGTAAELASARMEGLRGALEGLGNTLSTIGTRVGQGVTPAIQSIVVGITSFASAMAASESTAQAFGGSIEFVETVLAGLGQTLSTLATVVAPVAGALGGVANAIGVPTLLAALAVLKLFPPVLLRVRIAAAATAATLTTLSAVGPTLALRAAITGLAGAMNLPLLAATALGAGLFFLATRESAAERQTRQLRSAFDELSTSMASATTASDRLFSARRGAQTSDTAVDQALLAQRQAQAALSGTDAPRGSIEFLQLQTNLAVATQNVTFAVQDQERALRELNAAQEEQFATQQRRAEAVQSVVGRLTTAFEEAQRRTRVFGVPRGSGVTAGEAAANSERRARELLLETFNKEADVLRKSDDANERSIGARLSLLGELFRRVQTFPSTKEIRFLINAADLTTVLERLAPRFGIEGDRAAALFVRRVRAQLGRGQPIAAAVRTAIGDVRVIMAAEGQAGGDAFTRAAGVTIESTGSRVVDAVRNVMARARAQIAGIERERLDLEIAGAGDAAILANLQQQAAVEEGILDRARADQRAGRVSFEAVRAAQENLAQTLSQIRSIQSQMSADAREAAEKAKADREQRDQDILDALGFRRDDAQERITDAQATEGLRDDIRRTRELRQLVLKQIETIGQRIKTAELRITALRELRRVSRELRREIRALQQQQQEELRERAAERLQLNIEFAQLTENRSAEIRARQAEIRRLKRLQAETRRGTNEYLRLRNLIAEQERAIKDLKDQQEKKNDSFKQLAFAFLQSQQGFAANLIGNLIPGDLTGGLVGTRDPLGTGRRGGIPVAGGRDLADLTRKQPPPGIKEFGGGLAEALLADRRTADAAGRAQGITSGQGNTQIDLLRKILVEVRRGNRSSDHPEAKEQRKTGSAALDYGGAISMGM